MKRVFIDTNIFLRYLTADVKDQAKQAKQLLETGLDSDEIGFYTSEAVVMEMVWTLESYYDEDMQSIAQKLAPILGFVDIVYADSGLNWGQAFKITGSENIDFIDAFNYLVMLENDLGVIASFDTDFDRLDRVERITDLS